MASRLSCCSGGMLQRNEQLGKVPIADKSFITRAAAQNKNPSLMCASSRCVAACIPIPLSLRAVQQELDPHIANVLLHTHSAPTALQTASRTR